MQTHEWEALLDGTTPGRWDRGANPREIYAVDDDAQAVFVGSTYRHNPQSGADADLFASAPAAVAEVVRLRRALEEQLKELSDELEAEGVETYDDIDGTWPSMQRYGELSEVIAQRNFLTHILEGDTDD